MFDFNHLAYLDPSTGSLVIQSVIGVALGAVVFARNAFQNLAAKLRKLFGKSSDKPEAEAKAD